MNTSKSFNEKLQAWLSDEERTIEEGCLLLLQMENNQIHYKNLLNHPKKTAVMKYLQTELQKRLKIRLLNVTHEEVATMEKEAENISKKRFLYMDTKEQTDAAFRKGMRADHDALPLEIQALYVENLELTHKMREVQMQLRRLSTQVVSCPDSERYPFLKDLIAMDKKAHSNWDIYDHYVPDEDAELTQESDTDIAGTKEGPEDDSEEGGSSVDDETDSADENTADVEAPSAEQEAPTKVTKSRKAAAKKATAKKSTKTKGK
ncbi:MAG: hypothetical protein K6F89_05250 [Prevotella sp.]|nr:hypothetical protein [Prevotella sp.]